MVSDSVFKDPENVKKNMDLPGVVPYSFVGESSPEYHAKLEEIVVRVAGEENVHRRSFRESSSGTYTAYKYDVFHTDFEDVESIYREVKELVGTKFLL